MPHDEHGGLAGWLERARRLVPAEDRKVLLSPPRLAARFVKFALRRAFGVAGGTTADDVRARDPELVTLVGELWRVLARYYFRLRVVGVENVPASGPILLVGNHSGGLLPSEGFFTALALHEHFGPDRALFALAHDFLFEDPTLRRYAARLGILRAGHDSAHHAFAAGGCVLVYPGSDMDTFRPFRDRNKIVLAGRNGFLKLALREGVPIVPVVTAGNHEQFVVLARGDRLARLLHAHAWARTEVLPLVLSFPWGLTTGFLPVPAAARPDHALVPAADELAGAGCRERGPPRRPRTLLSRGRDGHAGRARSDRDQAPVLARLASYAATTRCGRHTSSRNARSS